MTTYRQRLISIDLARTAALAAMAVFHFTFDLEMFGFAAQGTTTSPGWALFARIIAGSFVFLAGVSLVLAHGRGFRRAPFLRRLAQVAGAAVLVSAGTWLAIPHLFIYFGVLHLIATASLLGAVLLRAPAAMLIALAVLAAAAPALFRADQFNHAPLYILGLSTLWPASVDFVPVFPWLGAFLAGMALAKLTAPFLARRREGAPAHGPLLRTLAWPGRHSLIIYLLHQPVLMGLTYLAARVLRG